MLKSNIKLLSGILRRSQYSHVPTVRSVSYSAWQPLNGSQLMKDRTETCTILSEQDKNIMFFPSLWGLTERLARIVDGCKKKKNGGGACDEMGNAPAKSPCQNTTEKSCESLPCGFPEHPGICDGKVFPEDTALGTVPSEKSDCKHPPPCPKKEKPKQSTSKARGLFNSLLSTAAVEDVLLFIPSRAYSMNTGDSDDCEEKSQKSGPCKNMEKPCKTEKKEQRSERMPCNKTKTPCAPPKTKKQQQEAKGDPCASMYDKKCPPRTSKGDCQKPIVDPCAPRGECTKDIKD